VLAAAGLGVSLLVSVPLFLSCLSLWVMGLLYNIKPIRLKDQPYLDVLSESVNNPIRMLIGWYALGIDRPPTLSVLLAYWMFGAFLMAIKRFAELRHIGDKATASQYRHSFRWYNEERLLVSILFYAALFGMFSGVFISRYKVGLVLAIPFVGLAMASYFRLGFKPHSPAMYPERLWRYPSIVVPVGLAFVLCSVLLFADLSPIAHFFAPRFTTTGIPSP
jgi:4-hydroxybenzoate polyprenyltransferase